MKISSRSRYGLRLLLELAVHSQGRPLPATVLSENTGISVKYIEQIIRPLKKAGFVKSLRGAAGGHVLSMGPAEITLHRIVQAMEGGVELTVCCKDQELCQRADVCRAKQAWIHVTRSLVKELDAISLADLVEGNDSCATFCAEKNEPGVMKRAQK